MGKEDRRGKWGRRIEDESGRRKIEKESGEGGYKRKVGKGR